MPRSYRVFLAIFALIVVALFLWLAAPAHAHDWYKDHHDPITGFTCCGGDEDCAPVPLDADWVRPVEGGFQVTMTAEQAHAINKNMTMPVNAFIPWARVMSPPADAGGYGHVPALYHVCVWGNGLKCMFVVPGL